MFLHGAQRLDKPSLAEQMTCAAAADCEPFGVVEAGPAGTGHLRFARQREASEKGTMVGDFAGRVNVLPGP